MLQQTTVRAVAPRWRRFLERFPTIPELAAADEEEVLAEWSGLGYYSRARNLHRAARVAVDAFSGELPKRFELLLSLPGMGRYTAAAVASIAFGEVVAVVDANVERVVSRLACIREDVRTAKGKRACHDAAAELMEERRPGDWNQAVMELGALVCLPRTPQCGVCPVAKECGARREGDPERYPLMRARTPMTDVREAAAVVRSRGRVLVLKRPLDGSFAGMWEIPRGEAAAAESAPVAAARIAREITGLDVQPARPLLTLKHVVMRRRIVLHVWECSPVSGRGRVRRSRHETHRWMSPDEWIKRPASATQRDIARYLADGSVPEQSGAGGNSGLDSDTADLFGGNAGSDR